MKRKIYNNIIFILLSFLPLHAQVSTNEMPFGLKPGVKFKNTVPELYLGSINIDKQLEMDIYVPGPLRYCIYKDTIIDIKKIAKKSTIKNGNIWTYNIHTENAKSINVYFDHYEIPEGAKLFVYNKYSKNYLGAFTNLNQKSNKTFQVADLKGNELIIEYFEPYAANYSGKLIIGSLGLAYRDIEGVISSDFIDINCKEGDDWQLEKHAVCKITYRCNTHGCQCSGSLINNTAQDGTPYFLTANHCISTESEANTLVAYFNFEKSECGGLTVAAANQTVSGSELKATSSKTDFTLLLLDETPPAIYQPYYVGWNREDIGSSRAFTIHHPAEMTKKISIDNDSVTSYPFVLKLSPPNTHWQVAFDEGITIEGSSGSPLFNLNGQVVGQLHGGNTSGFDYYGKFSKSWDLNTFDNNRLEPWLDPIESGVTELNGFIPDNVVPDAHFTTAINNVCIQHPIEFINKSVLNAEDFIWEVDPPYITFLNGTGPASINPVIQFDSSAFYTISLLAQNENGTNQQVFNNYIKAGNAIETSYQIEKNAYCFYEFNKIKIEPFGADTLYWLTSYLDDYIESSVDKDANILLSLKNEIDTTLIANIKLVGEQGSCIDTSDIYIEILYTANDDVENAFPLDIGINGPFSNQCATIQVYEPVPPVGDNCAGKDYYWCNDYGNGSLVVENSIWFSFVMPESGNITIKTTGFNNQIAVYEADKAEDIISGNLNKYEIIAANDDYTMLDPKARLDSLSLIPNKKYWLQVDGYQGEEGLLTIELVDNFPSGNTLSKSQENPVKLYPNPSTSGIFLIKHKKDNILYNSYINVYNIEGKLLYREKMYPKKEKIDLSQFSAGIYVIRFVCDKEIFQDKILIY